MTPPAPSPRAACDTASVCILFLCWACKARVCGAHLKPITPAAQMREAMRKQIIEMVLATDMKQVRLCPGTWLL